MPIFLHQWNYKDAQVRRMIEEGEDRSEIVRIAIEAFKGKLLQFYYSFGRYDGLAISEFKDNQTALACMMSIFGQGRNHTVLTTPLIEPKEGLQAMRQANEIVRRQKQ